MILSIQSSPQENARYTGLRIYQENNYRDRANDMVNWQHFGKLSVDSATAPLIVKKYN